MTNDCSAVGGAYDVVVVGSGVTGVVLAKVLASLAYRDGKSISILILEAGTGVAGGDIAHNAYLDTYYGAMIKTPNAPYPTSGNAPSPEDLAFLKAPQDRYFVQKGKLPFGSNNLRMLGGTTHHWMGIALRMLPSDFELHERFGVGVNWPISYQTLKPFYEKAEWELGVSADTRDQLQINGVEQRDFGDYDFPMHRLPKSHLDKVLGEEMGDFNFEIDGQDYPARLVSIPQARNSTPNASAKDPRNYLVQRDPYRPLGAPDEPYTGAGQRCEGNASCIPICPSRAKYTALKTIEQLKTLSSLPGIRIDIVTKAVASDLEVDDTGNVLAINYLAYDEPEVPYATPGRATGRRFVLATSAIENAKLLLASRSSKFPKGVANTSGCVGQNLMDHPFILSWALMPEGRPVVGFRGPGVTSDLPMRDGAFRANRAAFRTDVGNWGWGLADGAPYQDVERLINPAAFANLPADSAAASLVPVAPLSGNLLKQRVRSVARRQITLGFLMEQLPNAANRVTIDDTHRDALGLHKPIIHYDIDDYTRSGMATAYDFATAFYKRVGALEFTSHAAALGTEVKFGTKSFKYIGAGHIVGTHRMGCHRESSVVDQHQRAWGHPNLYVVGCGSMPTTGTSNPTLTATALSILSAEHLFQNLELASR
jgi:choline dehydrogenase-like flavoprotein